MQDEENSSSQYVAIDEEMYAVQQIRGKRIVSGKPEYLVKWLNWDKPEDLTWEPPENLATVQDLIEEYERKGKKDGDKDKKEKQRKEPASKAQKIQKKKLRKESEISKPKPKPHAQKPKTQQKSQQDTPIKKQQQVQASSQDQSQSQSSHNYSSLGSRKPLTNIGCINAIYLKSKDEVYYEVDVTNSKGECIGVKLYPSKYIKDNQKQLLREYLEDYLHDEERMQSLK